MNKTLKYFIIFCIVGLGGWVIHLQMKKTEREKSSIYIDNYSGSPVKIMYKNDIWGKLEDQSSIIKKDLNQGTHILHIHKMDNSVIDTFRINIKKENNYVLNLFGGMTYYEGELIYKTKPKDGVNYPQKKERKIIKSFFQTSAAFIFERPPYKIEERSLLKMPTTKRKYLRRNNQAW